MTLFPLSIDPLIPIQPLQVKYLTPLMPLITFIVMLAAGESIKKLATPVRKRVIIGVNVAPLTFLTWSVAFESPFTYQFRNTNYPVKGMMFWKYDFLNKALRDGYGICSKKYIPIGNVKNMIRNYMNHDNILSDIKITNLDGFRVLHLKSFSVEDLKGAMYHSDLETIILIESCNRR